MAATPLNGLPYPLPADPVAEGAVNIRDLALAVDPKLATIGTALPASPVNGQEFILVDSLTAPTFAWLLRYLSAIPGASKWLPVGIGPPCRRYQPLNTGGTASTTYIDASSPVSLPVPVNGIYDVFHRALMHTGANYGRQSVKFGAAATVDADANDVITLTSTTNGSWVERLLTGRALAAATTLALQYRSNDGGVTIGATHRQLELRPVLLG